MKKSLDLILNKTKNIWELLLSVLLAVCVYQLWTIKVYQGYWSKLYLILSIILLILLLGIIIYSCKKSEKKLEKIFLTFIIPVGIFYMIFMLPTYAPDEISHIWRAYEISQGNILTKQDENGNSLGIDVPKEMIQLQHETTNTYAKLNDRINAKTDYNDTYNVISPAQSYCFILYIPAAIIFLLVRILNVNIIWGIYIAKLFNFIIFLMAGYYCIKKIPFGKYVIFTCLFLPMLLQQAVSLSADALINIISLVYITYTISLIFQKEDFNLKQKIIYIVLAIMVALAKMAYIPLIGLGFIFIFRKNMTKKDKILLVGLITILCLLIVIISYLYSSNLQPPEIFENYYKEENVNGAEQIKYIVSNPISFAKTLIRCIVANGGYYLYTMVGSNLGWLNININQLIIISFIIILAFSTIIENNELAFSKKQKLWNICIVIANILLVITALYLTWTGVGLNTILGVQGRYFLPILPLFLLTICMKNNYIKLKYIHFILPIILTILNGLVIIEVMRFFAV